MEVLSVAYLVFYTVGLLAPRITLTSGGGGGNPTGLELRVIGSHNLPPPLLPQQGTTALRRNGDDGDDDDDDGDDAWRRAASVKLVILLVSFHDVVSVDIYLCSTLSLSNQQKSNLATD